MKTFCYLDFLLILITVTMAATPQHIPPIVAQDSKNMSADLNNTLSPVTDKSTLTTTTSLNNTDLSNNTSAIRGSYVTQLPHLLSVVISTGEMDLLDLIEATAIAEALRRQPPRVFIRDTESKKLESSPTEIKTLNEGPMKNEKSPEPIKQNIVTAGDKPIGENSTNPAPCGTNSKEPAEDIVSRSIDTAGDKPIAQNTTALLKKDAGNTPEGNKNKTITQVTIEKTVSAILQSVSKKRQHEKQNETAPVTVKEKMEKSKESEVHDIDLDPEDDFPETARDDRELNLEGKKIKSETSTHNATLNQIEEKLKTTTVDDKVIREVLGIVLGRTKTDEILPKTSEDTISNKSKRSINLDKLPRRKLSNRELKMILDSIKPGTIEKKTLREKRSSDYEYMSSSNSFPETNSPSGHIPELLLPTLSPSTRMSSYENSVDMSSSLMNSPLEVPSRSASKFKYAVRTRPLPRNLVTENHTSPSTTTRLGGNHIGLSRSNTVTHSTKYISDLSDLPISRDFPILPRAEYENNDAVKWTNDNGRTETQFQKVRVTYEYEIPMQVSLPSDTRSKQRSSYESDVRDGPVLKSNVAEKVPVRRNVYFSGRRLDSDGPLPMPMDTPIGISYDISASDTRAKRFKRSAASKQISKRRVPMVLSAVSRLTRSGAF